jgi:branched-chain amino acid transport system ATP-binding protein
MEGTAEVIAVVRDVRVQYRNGAFGVVGVSLEIRSGQVVALFGPNGAGKTTTVRSISGFLRTEGTRVVRGQVEVFGKTVTDWEPHRISRLGVASVPERSKVFANLSVAENLSALGVRLSKARRSARYEQVMALFPMLAQRRHQLAGRLSGGQQQMLAIARSVLCDPKLLIIDEMTLGLHQSMHPPLFEAVRDIVASGTAVLLVDESIGLALDTADYCYLLTGGTVRSQGVAESFRGNEILAAGYVEASSPAAGS